MKRPFDFRSEQQKHIDEVRTEALMNPLGPNEEAPECGMFCYLPFTGGICVRHADGKAWWELFIMQWAATKFVPRSTDHPDGPQVEMADPSQGLKTLSQWKDVDFAGAMYRARMWMAGERFDWPDGVKIEMDGGLLFKLELDREELKVYRAALRDGGSGDEQEVPA